MDNNLVGQTIQGRYYVVNQLGRGGVGVTFLAQDKQCFNSQCVVKQLKPRSANPKTLEIARRLFNREAEIMNRLGHCDRIPRLLAYFEHEDEFFLVQELIEGHDLSQEIVPDQPWSEEKTKILLKDVLEVLLIVQQQNVIHRDLKPSNLMRRQKDDKIVLIDFGSVKQVSTQVIDASGQIKPTIAVGTKSYMPMEQMMGRPGFHSDIYAVGMIAIQAVTGVPPRQLTTDDDGELIWRNRLSSQVHYQPRFLDILDKMVRRLHQERYSSAGVVLSDLEQLDVDKNNNIDTIVIANRKSSTPSPSETRVSPPTTPLDTEVSPPATSSDFDRATEIVRPANPNPAPNPNQNQNITNSPNYYKPPTSPQRSSSKKKSQLKILTIILGGVALLVIGLGFWVFIKNKNTEPEPIKLSLYENPSNGFKVSYPELWSTENRDDFFATGVIFLSPLENDEDTFQEQVSILVEVLPQDMSIGTYTKESIAEIKKLSDPNVSPAQTINLGRQEAKQVVYSGEENGTPVRRMQTWLIKNNQAYVITYTAQPNSYESYLPTAEQMIESFEIVGN
jgi:eukaryotic-like serine/threonine-protein kinase